MPPVTPTGAPPAPQSNKTPLIAVVLGVLLLISLAGNAVIYMSRQDYKTKSDNKVQAAVAAAKTQQAAADKAKADEAAKAPYKTFTGSATYGSVSFNYPKTYSVYVDQSSTAQPINAYFSPDQVPSTQSGVAYALRVELVNTAYADVLNDFQSGISDGSIKAAAYIPPKLKSTAGVTAGMYLTGTISSENADAQGSLVIIKVRDKTLKIYTESPAYNSDYNDTVLASLTFAP